MDQIGRYRILGELGRGAMGVVYRAQDPAIGRVVAIKTIRLRDLVDASELVKLRDRLMREAQSAGILSHPNIVTIYDVVAEQDELAYIAMEFVDGPTLDQLVRTNPPDGKLVLSLLQQTAAALDYAHKRGIVHRDIKPANIMVHEGSTAKITDFGVARFQSHQMTQAGSMVGTPNYMSPEQIRGQAVDGSSDQFSLAVIAYELMTGEKPFVAESIPSLAFKIVQEDPVSAHRVNPTLDWPVDTVLKRGLSKDSAARYPSCSDFAVALENACRASRNWRPISPGTIDSLPTLAGATVRQATPAPVKPPAGEIDQTPAALRFARTLALVLVGGGLMTMATIAGFRYFDKERDSPAPAAVKDETAVQTAAAQPPKPSALGEPSAVAPTSPPPTEEPTAQPDPPSASKAAPAPAMTKLVTNPPGARLEVDGRSDLSCQSPCSLELPSGRHTMAANLDGYRRTLKIFQTPQESELFVNLERMSGTLVIRSEPKGAMITVDGETKSERTPAMLSLPAGRHTIEINRDNKSETREVVIRDGVISNLAITLE